MFIFLLIYVQTKNKNPILFPLRKQVIRKQNLF